MAPEPNAVRNLRILFILQIRQECQTAQTVMGNEPFYVGRPAAPQLWISPKSPRLSKRERVQRPHLDHPIVGIFIASSKSLRNGSTVFAVG
jgi:hypothetical protein